MQGFFGLPVDNVKCSPLLLEYIRDEVGSCPSLPLPILPRFTISARFPTATCASLPPRTPAPPSGRLLQPLGWCWQPLKCRGRAALIAKRLSAEFALIFGEQTKFAETLSEERLGGDGSSEGGSCKVTGVDWGADALAQCSAARFEASTATDLDLEEVEEGLEDACQGDGVIGDVSGKDVIIVDDLIDGADSFSKLSSTANTGAACFIHFCSSSRRALSPKRLRQGLCHCHPWSTLERRP